MSAPRWTTMLLVTAAWAAPARAQQAAPATRTTTVTYVTGQSVYIGAGTADGVTVGLHADVLRKGHRIAGIRVRYVSSHAAACEVDSGSALVNVGDSVRYVPATPPPAVAATPAAASTGASPGMGSSRSTLRDFGLRGRVGMNYVAVSQPDSGMGSFTQPSMDLRLDGQHLGGSALGLVVDARTRRTTQRLGDGTSNSDASTRVYQANLSWNPLRSGGRITVGRQFSAALANVSLFDGLTAQLDRRRWSFGLFGGTQPTPDLGFSTEVSEYGAFVQVHNLPDATRVWSVTTGAIDSYDRGQVNREYLYVQAIYTDRRLSLYATQEVDYNRGWKRRAGEPVLAPTSTFASAQYRLTDFLSLQGGVDNRRNVRLYRDYVNPVTTFDDSFREGVWGGLYVYAWSHVRAGADARRSSGGPAGNADSYTGSLGVDRLTPLELSLQARSTHYTGPQLSGWLHALSLGATPGGSLHLELNGGLRTEQGPLSVSVPTASGLTRVRWYGLDADIGLGRAWYLLLSATRTRGGFESNDQLFTSLSLRF